METNARTLGLHHMTAISTDAQANVDFYAGVLGLRLVKLTVNFDDPGAYHLYYGDGLGRPGTIVTYFPYPGDGKGQVGIGQVVTTSLSIPPDSLAFWAARLAAAAVPFDPPFARGDEEVLALTDPDGIQLELVASPEHQPGSAWKDMPVPEERAISGIRGVRIWADERGPTEEVLTQLLGLEPAFEFPEGGGVRLRAPGAEIGAYVDLLARPGGPRGRDGRGTVHHIALRVPDDPTQAAVRGRVAERGWNVTPVRDRSYFRSIYFREPGGVLIEVATDTPGFAVDEQFETLGTELRLPPQYEPYRDQILRKLPKLRLPNGMAVPA